MLYVSLYVSIYIFNLFVKTLNIIISGKTSYINLSNSRNAKQIIIIYQLLKEGEDISCVNDQFNLRNFS